MTIDWRDRRRLVVQLVLAELLARPGESGPLARRFPMRRIAPPKAPPRPQQPPAAKERP